MDRVAVGFVPQHLEGAGQLLTGLGVPAPAAQRPPSGGLGAGGGPGVPGPLVMIAGLARVRTAPA